MTYSEKLKDPRWQRKRLDILSRDSFTCQECQSATNTLHVHHKFYEVGKEPWEYDDKSLITLCADCHESEEYEKEHFRDLIKKILLDGFSYSIINQYLSGLYGPPVDFDKMRRAIIASVVAGDKDWLIHIDKIMAENSKDLEW